MIPKKYINRDALNEANNMDPAILNKLDTLNDDFKYHKGLSRLNAYTGIGVGLLAPLSMHAHRPGLAFIQLMITAGMLFRSLEHDKKKENTNVELVDLLEREGVISLPQPQR